MSSASAGYHDHRLIMDTALSCSVTSSWMVQRLPAQRNQDGKGLLGGRRRGVTEEGRGEKELVAPRGGGRVHVAQSRDERRQAAAFGGGGR